MVQVVVWLLGGVGAVHLFVEVGVGVFKVGVVAVDAAESEDGSSEGSADDTATDSVIVAVQKPSLPQVAMSLQHSSPQQVSASGQAPPSQQISVSVS